MYSRFCLGAVIKNKKSSTWCSGLCFSVQRREVEDIYIILKPLCHQKKRQSPVLRVHKEQCTEA